MKMHLSTKRVKKSHCRINMATAVGPKFTLTYPTAIYGAAVVCRRDRWTGKGGRGVAMR